MSNLQTSTPKDLKPMFTKFAEQIKDINPSIEATKFMAEVYHEYVTNEGLQKCSPTSILLCAKTAAQFGLMVGKNFGLAWIVPYWNNKLRCSEAQFQLGYKGMILLAARSGITIYPPNCIYENDKYKIDEANNIIKHERILGKPRGAPLAYYVIAKNQFGEKILKIMEMDEIYKRKEQSLSKIKDEMKKYSPWLTWEHEMCLKTVVKSLFKILAIDEDLRELVEKEEINITEDAEEIKPGSIIHVRPGDKDFPKSMLPEKKENWYMPEPSKIEIEEEFVAFDEGVPGSDKSINMQTGEIIEEPKKEELEEAFEKAYEDLPEHKKSGFDALKQAKEAVK